MGSVETLFPVSMRKRVPRGRSTCPTFSWPAGAQVDRIPSWGTVFEPLACVASEGSSLPLLVPASGPPLQAALLCTHLVPGGAFGVGAQYAPAPPPARKPESFLLCPPPNYKSSFSSGTSMLREYQMIQKSRLKARIRDPV